MTKITMAAIACLMLSACASGPGKADIEKALAAYFKQATFMTPAVRNLEVGDCVKDQASAGFVCAVSAELEFTVSASGRTTTENLTGTFVFGEVGDEWKVISQR